MALMEFGPDDRAEYSAWLNRNSRGFVMILQGRDIARLHEADCSHVDPYPHKRGMHKVVGHSVKDLRAWANAHGRRFVQCQRCR